jgi:transcriptional regulator with XRE-family HTH domain
MKRLALYLADTRTTQAQLAKALGVSQPTVSDWVTGEKFPSTEKLRRISQHTGITTDELLGIRPRKRA